jgi:hypothetical protein
VHVPRLLVRAGDGVTECSVVLVEIVGASLVFGRRMRVGRVRRAEFLPLCGFLVSMVILVAPFAWAAVRARPGRARDPGRVAPSRAPYTLRPHP